MVCGGVCFHGIDLWWCLFPWYWFVVVFVSMVLVCGGVGDASSSCCGSGTGFRFISWTGWSDSRRSHCVYKR